MGAGLPDILGDTGHERGKQEYISGCFEQSDFVRSAYILQSSTVQVHQLLLRASKSNAIYGSSATVTPKSLSCLLFIKF